MYRDTCFSLGCCAAICLRVEHYASCFARALGLVHRQVCGMHQLFGLLFSIYSYADARGSVQPELISIGEGDTKLCLEVLCDPNRSAGIGDVLQQDGELIPPKARTYVCLSQAPLQALGHLTKHPIPFLVA
jgi:hypothetical protein